MDKKVNTLKMEEKNNKVLKGEPVGDDEERHLVDEEKK